MKIQELRRLLDPLWRALRSQIVAGSVRLVYTDKKARQMQVSLLSGETRDRVDAIEPYGFTAIPKAGAELVAARLYGAADNTIVLVAGDRRYRLTGLTEGEVAIYDDQGSYVKLARNGRIEIKASGGVTIDGDLEVLGDVKDQVGTLAALRQAYNQHTHTETGGSTGPPTPQA